MRPASSQKEAISRGLQFYFTGNPCKRDHVADRRAINGICLECEKMYRSNKVKSKVRKAREKTVTPEQEKERRRQWYIANRDRNLGKMKAWREKNPHANRVAASKRRKRIKKQTPKWYGELDDFIVSEAHHLAVLREKATGIEWHVDHIIPIHGKKVSGLHCAENLRVISGLHNRSKHNNFEV